MSQLRVLSYNIRHGGVGRESQLAAVIARAAADLVILQEASRPAVVERLAGELQMRRWASRADESVGFMSRVDVRRFSWHRASWSRRGFLELALADGFRVIGVHLTAVHSNWTERLRVRELRAILDHLAERRPDPHLVTGDFNTLAPGELLDMRRLPRRYRLIAWLTGREIRWQTIRMMLEAEYADGYRLLHAPEPGFTFPTWDPHVRLDYVFVPAAFGKRLVSCDVVTDDPDVRSASDHFPLVFVLARE